jgi:hypothetical protein
MTDGSSSGLPGERPGYSIGEAMGWSWTMFTRHAGLLVATTVILGILGVAIATLLGSLLNTVSRRVSAQYRTGRTSWRRRHGASRVPVSPYWGWPG